MKHARNVISETALPPSVDHEPSADAAAGPPPRKRRRRTAGGGASDDCFACQKRAVQCGRERPYCAQCIAIGRECSGYKTTLTWGVGVASRGKLRGLSYPVASANGSTAAKAPATEERRRKTPASKAKAKPAASTPPNPPSVPGYQLPLPSPSNLLGGALPTPHPTPYPPSFQPPAAPPPQGWHLPSYHELQLQTENPYGGVRHSPYMNPSFQRIQSVPGVEYDAIPRSASSTGSYTDTEYHSPAEWPRTPGSVTFQDPFATRYTSHTSQPLSHHVDGISHGSSSGESYRDDLATPIDPRLEWHGTGEPQMYDPNLVRTGPEAFHMGTNGHNEMLTGPMEGVMMNLGYLNTDLIPEDDVETNEKSLAIFDPRFSSTFFHVTPRLQSLMEYYDRYVCPFLVAFDGSENPYRRYILQLAFQSDGLQNAIAALASNNMRMRKEVATKQIGFVEEIPDPDRKGRSASRPSPEESCYKQLSIDQLNMQLADKNAAQDDSVLATLLVLCLFHVCDSGFSKFKTQLAGMQKLLSMRSGQSEFTGWIQMFFIWFDVMTSTVNDREMQIRMESLDMLDYTANLGALEQFSGCDGRLFKLIARLGRLNLLAQGRPVRRLNAARNPSHASLAQKNGMERNANRSRSTSDYTNLDGNGWATQVPSPSQDAENAPGNSNSAHPPDRQAFWAEWTFVRSRLQAWQIDPDSIPHASPRLSFSTQPPDLGANHRDLIHINESFRYSALLYTERLGSPLLPSAHPNMQDLVAQALYHITALPITSCVNKFLLWPLFITGTECVDEAHRNLIRTRCIELSKESGFYNNMSGLEVLEKVWKEAGVPGPGSEAAEVQRRGRDSETETSSGRYPQAFRWRKAMDRVDGEYIVI